MSGGHQWAPETVFVVVWILGSLGNKQGENLRPGGGIASGMMPDAKNHA
jgi:hypothetical protein